MTKNELMSILDLPEVRPRHDFISSGIQVPPTANEMTPNEVNPRTVDDTLDQNDSVPGGSDYGTTVDHEITKTVVMHANSYDPSYQHQISYVDQPTPLQGNIAVENKSPVAEDHNMENAEQHYRDDQPLSEQVNQQIYQQVITRAHSDADIAKMNHENSSLSRQNSESSVTLPPISWSSKSDYSKPDGRPGSVQPKLYHEQKSDWRDKMDAHFTKKFGTHTRTTIIHQGPHTHTHTQNWPLTRSMSVPARMFDPACSTSHPSGHEMTYSSATYAEHASVNYVADDAASGQTAEEHQNHGNSVIYYHQAQMNSECESADIHYTNTYSVAANQNHLFQPGPDTMICYTTLPAVKSTNQKADLMDVNLNQIINQQIQIANSAPRRYGQSSENGVDLNISSICATADVPLAPTSRNAADHDFKKVPRIEYEPKTDQEPRPVRVSEAQNLGRKTVPVSRNSPNIQTADSK